MILIIGCGFLGSYLAEYASSETDEKILATVRDINGITPLQGIEYMRCDLTDKSDLTQLAEKCKGEPLTVFYLAACHNVDYVYEYPDKAKQINIKALQDFLAVMPEIKKLFFSSTDCVYGESEKGFRLTEAAELNPVNEYGRQKLKAEKIVISEGFTVLRLPFMLGPSLNSKPHFYDTVLSKLKNGESIEMIDGMKRSVLSYAQAAELIYKLSLLPDSLPNAINVCSDTELSKYEIGRILAKKINAPLHLIKGISENEGKKFFKDRRASSTAMDNALLKALIKTDKIIWDEIKI